MSTATRRVVFVDDDPLVLRSIRRLMSRVLSSCDLVFTQSGSEALEVMKHSPVDILVTDLNMDQMDGATLLQLAQADAPGVVRIVLSGSTRLEEGCITRVAHQCVAKPFDGAHLGSTLQRALSLRDLLDNDRLRALVAGKNELPAVPRVYMELLEALEDPATPVARIVALVESDPGLAARVLQLASSAFLGRVVPPRTVRDAVVFVGVTLMKAFVLTHRIVEMYQPKVQGFSVDAVQRAALMTGALASGMFATRARSEPAFVAGMMHNLGTLVLATRFPRRYAAVLRAQAGERRSLAHIEFDMLGATHAEVGAYLLGLWGIAPEVVEAVALAQSPSKIVDRTLGLSAAVYIASRLVHDPDTAVTPCEDRDGDIDAGLVNRLGLASELEGWRQAARHVVGEGSQ